MQPRLQPIDHKSSCSIDTGCDRSLKNSHPGVPLMLSDAGISLRLGAKLHGDQMEATSSCDACWVAGARCDSKGSSEPPPSVARLESCCSGGSSYFLASDRMSRESLARLLRRKSHSVHCPSLAPSSFFQTLGLQDGYERQRLHSTGDLHHGDYCCPNRD